MASPSTVITLGFGSFGSVNLLPTLGYGISNVVIVSGPYRISATQVFVAGARISDVYRAGGVVGEIYVAGGVVGQLGSP